MIRNATFLVAAMGMLVCASSNAQPVKWVGSSGNCNGSGLTGKVTYMLYYGHTKRPSDTGDQCRTPAAPGVYENERIPVGEERDLCELLKEEGDWYVAMTAETTEDGISAYSNEILVSVTPGEAGVLECEILSDTPVAAAVNAGTPATSY